MDEIGIASTTTVEASQIFDERAEQRREQQARRSVARAIVFRALRLLERLLPCGRRGVETARELCRAVARAWDRRVLDLEGTPVDLALRFLRAADLSRVFSEQSLKAAFLLLHETCSALFVRVNCREYCLPLGELRDVGRRLVELELWCIEGERSVRDADLRLEVPDTRSPRLSRIRDSLHSRLSRFACAPTIPRPAPVLEVEAEQPAVEPAGSELARIPPEDALAAANREMCRAAARAWPVEAEQPAVEPVPAVPELARVPPEHALAAARAELERLGPAVEGEGGDRKTFVQAAVGGDFGLSADEFRPVLQEHNQRVNQPPWSDRDLEKKLGSAYRNRKRPFGWRLTTFDGRTFEIGSMQPVSKDRSHSSCFDGQSFYASVWARAWALNVNNSEVAPAWAWARARRLDCGRLVEEDVVRVLPRDATLTECRFERKFWSELGYRLLFATYDVRGELVGLRARHIDGADAATSETGEAPRPGAKELNPRGLGTRGLVFANRAARAVLRGELRGATVWIAEGGPDFATLVSLLPSDVAVLGIFEGSWSRELAERVGVCGRVVVATDPDAPGEKYCRLIVSSLSLVEHPPELLRLRLRADVNRELRQGRLDLGRLRPLEHTRQVPSAAVDVPLRSWDERTLRLIRCHAREITGSPREVARVLLLCHGERVTPATVRGVERALLRLRETGRLPAAVTLTAAQPLLVN